MESCCWPESGFISLNRPRTYERSVKNKNHGSVDLPFVIPSEAEGSAVPRTFRGNVFRQGVAQFLDD